jgi:hypothetical protein
MRIVFWVVGGVCVIYGIIMGNNASWGITDAANARMAEKNEMFSSINVIDPPSPDVQRRNALKEYEETQPDGPLLKRLRVGQLLVFAGSLIAIVGIFI